MSNPWKKIASSHSDSQNLSDIMSEQYAKGLQIMEEIKFAKKNVLQPETKGGLAAPKILKQIEDFNAAEDCNTGEIIAKVLHNEYDDNINLIENKKNGTAKASVSLKNDHHVLEHLVFDSDSEEDIEAVEKNFWDRFECYEKEYASLPKRGYITKDDEEETKNDIVINGRRNACRIMALLSEICIGDNQLNEHRRHHQTRKKKVLDKEPSQASAEMGLDQPTRFILFQLIFKGLLEEITGVISTGKESVVLHANGDTAFPDLPVPKECAIKVFKTRNKFIEADNKYKYRVSKHNPIKVMHTWAEKEMHNMVRLKKVGVNCPDFVFLKKHVLVMSFIGKDSKSTPKLRDAIMKPDKWESVYNEVVEAMHKMYNVGWFIHADLSESNILWWDNKCWFIDVPQSVQPDHPNGLQFLFTDCCNISNFFSKKGLPNVKTGEELFRSITGFDDVDVNVLEGLNIVYNSLSNQFEIAPDDKGQVHTTTDKSDQNEV